jgi:ribosomal protein S11
MVKNFFYTSKQSTKVLNLNKLKDKKKVLRSQNIKVDTKKKLVYNYNNKLFKNKISFFKQSEKDQELLKSNLQYKMLYNSIQQKINRLERKPNLTPDNKKDLTQLFKILSKKDKLTRKKKEIILLNTINTNGTSQVKHGLFNALKFNFKDLNNLTFNKRYTDLIKKLLLKNINLKNNSDKLVKSFFSKQYLNYYIKNFYNNEELVLHYKKTFLFAKNLIKNYNIKLDNVSKILTENQLSNFRKLQEKFILNKFKNKLYTYKLKNINFQNILNNYNYENENIFSIPVIKDTNLKERKTLFLKRKKEIKSFYNNTLSFSTSEAFNIRKLYKRDLKYSLAKMNSKLLKNSSKLLLQGYQSYKNIYSNNKVTSLPQHIITIKITPNNTMLTLADKQGNVLIKMSAGKIKLNSSKKNYKSVCHMVITAFFSEVKKTSIKKKVLVKLIAPKNLRKKVLRRVKYYSQKHRQSFIEHVRLLPFNGCRPPKSRRKKRKGLRLFK